MRKRLSSRLLAVILTIAICATTVLGCLMTVGAETSCYSFGAAEVNEEMTQATLSATITAPESLPNGFYAGAFGLKELNANDEDCLTLKGVSSNTEGVNVAIEGNYVTIDTAEAKDVITMTFTFGFSKGTASKGKTYLVQLQEVELAYSDSEHYVESAVGAIGKISTECEHVVTVIGDPIKVDEANNYSVYEKSVCTICGEEFGMQFVPTAGKLGSGDDTASTGKTIQWDGTKVAPTVGTGTETDPYIISEVSHLAYITEAGPDYTHGKFFKVADGISNIVLQKAADAQTLINIKSAEEAKTYLSSLTGKSRWNTGKYDAASAFCGTFDGNDATIYGLSADTSINISLFGSIGCNAEFKNLNIKNSFVQTGWYAATLAHVTLGYTLADGTAVSKGTVKIHDCTFAQNYINPQSGVDPGATGNQCIAVILGQTGSSASGSGLALNNVLTYDNITFYEKTQTNVSPLIGSLYSPPAPDAETATEYCEVMDCIFLDVTSHLMAAINNNLISYKNAQSVYSDSYWIQDWIDSGWYNAQGLDAKTVSKAEMLGTSALTAAPNLAWGTDWILGAAGELPSRAGLHYVSDTIYWDGSNTKTAPTVGSGTKNDPYIISSVAELAYISGQLRDNYGITDGKFYKIADGIKNIVMQPYAYGAEIMTLKNAAEVKAYFEANSANLKQWIHYGWEGSTFCGNIDFNGATVYGIYQTSTDNAGLFSNIDAGAVISNLAIRNSYMKSESPNKNYQVGAIGAVTNGDTYGKAVKGIIWLKNIVVANNYMYDNVVSTTNNERAGVIIGASSDAIYVDNALVYGNDATYGDGAIMPIMSTASNSADEDTAVPEGLVISYGGTHGTTGKLLHNNMVRNSIILGANPVDYSQGRGSRFNDPNCFENVYTDVDIASKTFSDGKTVLGAKDDQIAYVSADAIKGTTAKDNMPGLTWGTDWFCGSSDEYPSLGLFTTFGVKETSNAAHKLYGSSVTYNDDGTFDFNLHFVPEKPGIKAVLYVGTKDATKFYKIEATESSYRDDLGDSALMFTLPNISARDIDKTWLPTIVVEGSAMLEWGQTTPLALVDNAKGVLNGDYATADKAVSAALINYGSTAKETLAITKNDYKAGTIDLLEFGDYLVNDLGSTSKWYDTKLADNGETGADWENAIIIDSAEELVYLCKASGDDTDGKYYKVADGIAGFNLSTDKLDVNGTLAGKSLASGKTNLDIVMGGGKNHAGGTPGFQGHFDGNGATVYGAWTNHNEGQVSAYAGLFSCTKGDVTIKNINVNKAHFTATAAAGGIIGYYKGEGTNTNNTTLTIENCSVTDSYLEVTQTGYGYGVGAVLGRVDCPSSYVDTNDEDGDSNTTETLYVNNKVIIKNCYVNLDEDNFVSLNEGTSVAGQQVSHGGVAGHLGSNALDVNNCIVIGITPYATSISNNNNAVQHSGLESHFSNVYTTDDVAIKDVNIGGTLGKRDFTGKIIPLTKEQLTGTNAKANMPTLNWDTLWTTTSGYPTFIANGYKAPASGGTIYWDGTIATGFASGTGTKADPYIIATASQLAYLVKDNATVSPNKYFKIADGISNIVLQSATYADDIIALGSAADVKAYFEANAASMKKWPNYGWEGSSFCGYFDGNGATVYGLYQVSGNNAGLFSTVDAGAVISNIALKNSYLKGEAANKDYQVAGLAAVSNSNGYGAKQEGVIWFNGCTVANNYMYNNATSYARSGIIVGNFQNDIIMIDNCIVYGNDATYGAGVKMSAYGDGNNDVETTKLMPAELPSYVENGGYICNTIRNSIILDCDAMNTACGASYRKTAGNCYVNVYTNGASGSVAFGQYTFTYDGITAINAADVKGDAAATIVSALNAAQIGDTTWYVGATGDMPGHKEAGSMPSAFQVQLDGITFDDKLDTVGDGAKYNEAGNMIYGVYQTALSLKANPYMSFAFAFGKDGDLDYKVNRDKIKIKFTYTVAGTTESVEVAVPAYVEGEDLNEAGWTNTAKNGRFHTFRADMIPVGALANDIKVEASYDGGEYVEFGTYSVAGLGAQFEAANKVTPGDYYSTRVEAAKALLFYAQTIEARYGA